MAITMNRWSPDTCDCILEFSFDPSLSADLRTHTATSVIKACLYHPQGTPTVHMDTVQTENILKNVAVIAASGVLVVKPEEVVWLFDIDRKLVLDSSKMSAQTISDVQAAVDTAVGSGKVILSDISALIV